MTQSADAAPRGAERRQFPRFQVRERLLGCVLSTNLPARIRDLGFGGFALETVEPLAVGAVESIRFTARNDRSTTLKAASLHCRPSCTDEGAPCFLTGFEFVSDQGPDAARQIEHLIGEVTSAGLYEGQS
jgi:PilZ domain